MLSSLTWKTLARKNIKKQNRLVFRLKALFLLKNIFCLYFSPIAKLWPRKKVIFKVFVFWRYSKTLIKRRSKVQEKNMSCQRALNVDQWKIFSENYKPMRVWLWLVYKFTKNYCCSWLFSEFIQTQRRYPTSLDKIRILTWKLLALSS